MKQEYIQQMFEQAADEFAANVAISHRDRRVTYAALESESNRLANFLLDSGAAKGSIVGILAEDPLVTISAIIGVLKAGCVFVPFDPRSPVKRLAALVGEVSPKWFVVESKFFSIAGEVAGGAAIDIRVVIPDGGEEYATYTNSTRPVVSSMPDDLCYIYFTSGSTGRPKGIVGRLKGIDHFIRWEIKTLGIGPECRASQLITPSFDAYLRDIFVPLCAGGTLCVPDTVDTVLDGSQLVEWLSQQRISLVHCVPSLFRLINSQEAGANSLAELRYVVMSGEALLPADVGRWVESHGDRTQLVNFYGPTETTMTKFCYFVQPEDKDRRLIPIGKPMEGARALVVSPKGEACPPGKIGEIYIRTPFRTLGYYGQPELTSEVFVPNPFNNDPNDLVYKTGDLGRVLDDGNFEFLGRKDHQVKIRGVRIELVEIENLLRRHESIGDVVVVAREDTEGNKFLCAYVVLDQQVDTVELKSFLSDLLPESMVPSAFVVMDALPRTISGKVDRNLLPAPGHARSLSRSFVAPRTPVEMELAAIWAEVLGIPEIGIRDNFFASGGHSLLATQLISRTRTAFGIDLPLRALFNKPTVEGLSLIVTQMQLEQENQQELEHLISEIAHLSAEDLQGALNKETRS